ncbi:hypothetical protein JCM9533A_56500 [Catenuloplanes niger JCM 9533]
MASIEENASASPPGRLAALPEALVFDVAFDALMDIGLVISWNVSLKKAIFRVEVSAQPSAASAAFTFGTYAWVSANGGIPSYFFTAPPPAL